MLENFSATSGLPETDRFVGRSGDHDSRIGQDDAGPDPESVAFKVENFVIVDPDLEKFKPIV